MAGSDLIYLTEAYPFYRSKRPLTGKNTHTRTLHYNVTIKHIDIIYLLHSPARDPQCFCFVMSVDKRQEKKTERNLKLKRPRHF